MSSRVAKVVHGLFGDPVMENKIRFKKTVQWSLHNAIGSL